MSNIILIVILAFVCYGLGVHHGIKYYSLAKAVVNLSKRQPAPPIKKGVVRGKTVLSSDIPKPTKEEQIEEAKKSGIVMAKSPKQIALENDIRFRREHNL